MRFPLKGQAHTFNLFYTTKLCLTRIILEQLAAGFYQAHQFERNVEKLKADF